MTLFVFLPAVLVCVVKRAYRRILHKYSLDLYSKMFYMSYHRWHSLHLPIRPYVRNILSCQSASLVNSNAQQPCRLPLGWEANKQMRTERESEIAARAGGGRRVRHDFCVWFHPPADQLNEKGRKFKQPYKAQAASSVSLAEATVGNVQLRGKGEQMPNTSTAGHSLKGNPPPTNPHYTNIHIKEQKKKRLHSVSDL